MKCYVKYLDITSAYTEEFDIVDPEDVEVDTSDTHTIVCVKDKLWLIVPTERFIKVEVTQVSK